jgi:hypothetical protein
MRSCALRIFDAATISIALVIFRVLCTLRILRRISWFWHGSLSLRVFDFARRDTYTTRSASSHNRSVQHLLVLRDEILLRFHL